MIPEIKRKILGTPPFYLLAGILTSALLPSCAPKLNWIVFPYTFLGAVFLGLGLYWIGSSYWTLKKHSTPVNYARSTHIARDGLYHCSRNPMYIGFILFLLGCSIISGNLLSFFAPPMFFAVINWMFIPYEEEKMQNTFGKDYLEYTKQTRRWF